MAEIFRYAAFISYSSKDARFARRLHRALESYGVPASLGKFDLIGGGKKNRLYPVFRDREELSAGSLGDLIEANLKASATLIVVCSPNAAASPWVEKEIAFFAGLGRREKIFAIIADDAPLRDDNGADATVSCFPSPFRADALADASALEPLAADARKGKDGFRGAWLKVVAGMIGVSPGRLIDRDRRRRRNQRMLVGAGASAAAVAIGLASAAVDAQARRADLTAHAVTLLTNGPTLDAANFALAGLPARGDAIAFARPAATDAVLGAGVQAAIAADLGAFTDEPWAAELSPDGRYLLSFGPDGVATLRDLREGTGVSLGRASALRPLTPRFSSDGRALLTIRTSPATQMSGVAALRDLETGDTRELGVVGHNAFAFSPDGRFLVIHHRDGGDGFAVAHDLSDGSAARLDDVSYLEAFGQPALTFGAEGAVLLALGRDGAVLHDLNRRVNIPIGPIDIRGFYFSRNGAYFFAADPDGVGALYDLRSGEGRTLGAGVFAVSGDGAFALVRSGDAVILRDLRNGTEISLGPLVGELSGGRTGWSFSRDGRHLLTGALLYREGEGNMPTWTLRDLQSGSQTNLGVWNLALFSPDGRYLALGGSASERSALVRELSSGAERALNADFDDFAFSKDGRFLHAQSGLLQRQEELVDLHTGARAPLGGFTQFHAFSADGSHYLGFDGSSPFVLRDLRAPIATTRGRVLREEICGASGDAIRPFPPAIRNGAESRDVTERLRGRPWNPCDWRGFMAILPDRDRGDAWFEGPRQWLRLMSVRYFGAADWSCAETIAGASATRRARRVAMCAAYASDAGFGGGVESGG